MKLYDSEIYIIHEIIKTKLCVNLYCYQKHNMYERGVQNSHCFGNLILFHLILFHLLFLNFFLVIDKIKLSMSWKEQSSSASFQ